LQGRGAQDRSLGRSRRTSGVSRAQLSPANKKAQQPETIIFWAQDDIFFTRAGGEAYLADLPKAEMHRLEAGHFAVQDCLDYISEHMRRFYRDRVPPKAKP
jgi:pimeloyl-ACP methyl ester carboxylesterase